MSLFNYGMEIKKRKELELSWDEFFDYGKYNWYILHNLYDNGIAIQYQLEYNMKEMLYYDEVDIICN